MGFTFEELREFVSRSGRTVKIKGANGEATFSPEHPDGTGLPGVGPIPRVLESVLEIEIDGNKATLAQLEALMRRAPSRRRG